MGDTVYIGEGRTSLYDIGEDLLNDLVHWSHVLGNGLSDRAEKLITTWRYFLRKNSRGYWKYLYHLELDKSARRPSFVEEKKMI